MPSEMPSDSAAISTRLRSQSERSAQYASAEIRRAPFSFSPSQAPCNALFPRGGPSKVSSCHP